jgi:putative flippase GtrA
MHLQFIRFCLVGVLGFLADAATTLMMTQEFHIGPIMGRIGAFIIAASITWFLNRRYTFRSTAGDGSWAPYLALTAFGAMINIGTYKYWVQTVGTMPAQLVIGVALGSIVALAFNFAVSRYLVFADAGR